MNIIHYGKQTIEQDDIVAVTKSLTANLITTGPVTKEFENSIAQYTGAKYCVAVSSGTAALHLVSLCLLNKGDKVLTTPNSFLATSNSILYAKAKPIFVDICEDGNIDLDLCEQELKKDSSITAIYVVSFSGKIINQEKLKYLKETYNVIIVEDNAHTIGAVYNENKAGSCKYSNCSIFSFHPVKNITTGEGGAISTNSEELYNKLLLLRTHGMVKSDNMKPWEYQMQELGFNYRITDIQCALGLSQLSKLNTFIEKRVQIAKRYDGYFEDSIVTPLYTYEGKSAYHLYVVKIDFTLLSLSKVELYNKLHEKKIAIQIHYMPINKQPYYKNLGYGDENTPVMDKYYEECLSLPIYPLLTLDEQKYVVTSLFEILNDKN
jgi:UDP-4-amino-4,6-dideoxy-N-acetyl-beta-L-altrosamine transaminase